MPMLSQRWSRVSACSSKAYTTERSPRVAASFMNCIPSVVFPTPLGPLKMEMVPRSIPPPSISSSSGMPEEITSTTNSLSWAAGIRCG